MKRIVCIKPEETISINKINDDSGCDYMTIISYKHGKPSGMISKYKGKYIHKISCDSGCAGVFDTIKECISASMDYDHTFYLI